MKNRFAFLRKKLNITQDELGKKLGIPKTSISAWENGKRAIPIKHLEQIAQIFQLNDEDMLDLMGNFFGENKSTTLNSQNTPLGTTESKQDLNRNDDLFYSERNFPQLITTDELAAYNPGFTRLEDYIKEKSTAQTFFLKARENDFAVRIDDDRFAPYYPAGTTLLLRPYPDEPDGKRVIAVMDSGKLELLVYKKINGKIYLLPLNLAHVEMKMQIGKKFAKRIAFSGLEKYNLLHVRFICSVIESQRNEEEPVTDLDDFILALQQEEMNTEYPEFETKIEITKIKKR